MIRCLECGAELGTMDAQPPAAQRAWPGKVPADAGELAKRVERLLERSVSVLRWGDACLELTAMTDEEPLRLSLDELRELQAIFVDAWIEIECDVDAFRVKARYDGP